MKILVTGAAGFIGSKMAYELAQKGNEVVGIDNINDYYDVRLKYKRLEKCGINANTDDMPFDTCYESNSLPSYKFIRMGIDNRPAMEELFKKEKFDKVVNFAAQAGVRYSITNPYSYMNSNMLGFLNILECCRHSNVRDLVFASSSSVYGLNTKVPFSEDDSVNSPVSLYAASKRSDELMAHTYCKLYGLHAVGLRYFTVYGPWGRPDMAPMLFAKNISAGLPIKVFNNGNLSRDFTYIDDIIDGTMRIVDMELNTEKLPNGIPFDIFNIGCGNPMKLMDFINEIEMAVGKKSEKIMMDMQPGDVYRTYADTSKLEKATGYKPSVTLHEGIGRFMQWYKSDENPLK